MDHAALDVGSSSEALRALLDRRFSCRGYRAEALSQETLDAIVAMAQRTPSWCNSQPWQVHITQPSATERFRAALSQSADNDTHWDIPPPAEYQGVYRDRRKACGWQLYESVGIKQGDRTASAKQGAENFRFFGAPHLAIITTEASLGPYGILDCGAYVNNFMLAAASLHVATIAQAAIASKSHLIRDLLKLPASRQVVVGISLGYEEAAHPANQFRTPRADLRETVTFVA